MRRWRQRRGGCGSRRVCRSTWSEGEKAKPWRRDYRVKLINSDPGLLAVFLRFLESIGVVRTDLTYWVSIHESADPEAATRWWSETLGLPPDRVRPAIIKRHSPWTNRHNTGSDYHGCLIIYMPRGREVYWLLEGIMKAACEAVLRDLGVAAR